MVERDRPEGITTESPRPGKQCAKNGFHGRVGAVADQHKRLAGPDEPRRSGHRIQHAGDLLDGSQRLRRVGKTIP